MCGRHVSLYSHLVPARLVHVRPVPVGLSQRRRPRAERRLEDLQRPGVEGLGLVVARLDRKVFLFQPRTKLCIGLRSLQPLLEIVLRQVHPELDDVRTVGSERAFKASNLFALCLERFLLELAAHPLHSHPGDTYAYGQTGAAYEVLGAVIEIASGMTLEAFMQREIFQPLGMEDTAWFLAGLDEDALAVPTEWRGGGYREVAERRRTMPTATRWWDRRLERISAS